MRIYVPAKADWTCPNCHAVHSLEIERDENGGYIEPDTLNCMDDDCNFKLCSKCPQGYCDGCLLAFCREHLAQDEGGDWFCRDCAKRNRLDDLALMDDQETQRHVAGIAKEEVQGPIKHGRDCICTGCVQDRSYGASR